MNILKKIIESLGYKLIDKNLVKNQRLISQNSSFNMRYILKLIFNQNDINNLIQIGANDGVRFDEISEYIKDENLKSILIEPIPRYFEQLKKNYKNYKNIYFEQTVISKNNEVKTLFCVKKEFLELYDSHINGINSNDINHLLKHKVKKIHIEEVNVESMTFDQLINKYKIRKLDFLYIDAEGYDGQIVLDFLKNSNLDPVIIFEYIHIKENILKKVIENLKDNKFKLFSINENLICYKNNIRIL